MRASVIQLLLVQTFSFAVIKVGEATNAADSSTGIVYHTPEENPPTDRCGYKDPEFPYGLTKLSDYRLVLTIIHGAIMVWVFVFFIPVSVFPVLWHRIAPNKQTGRRKIKRWLLIHIWCSKPVYPLMLVSVVCAMIAKHDSKEVLGKSSCSFYNQLHELLGILCFLIYTFQYSIGFFCSESLKNDLFKGLRFYHGLSSSFGYCLSIPLLAMARLSNEEGAKRYIYIVSYFYFWFTSVTVHVRMKFADYAALEWHINTEAEIANENRGIILRTYQWLWNFGFPSKEYEYDSHLVDLETQRSISRARIKQYMETYNFYFRKTAIYSFVISLLMTIHLGLLGSGIFLSSANYFPQWSVLGDFTVDWSLLKIYAL